MNVQEQVTNLALAALRAVADTPAALLALSADLEQAVKELQIARRELERRALVDWPKDRDFRLAVDGVGVFERGWKGARYRWEDRPVGIAVVDASMDRIDHPRDVVDALLSPASVGYWRTSGLDQLGVEWRPYRETVTPGQPCLVKAR